MSSVDSIISELGEFFFAQESVIPLAILRLLLGALFLFDLVRLWPERYVWLGNDGPISHAGWISIVEQRISLFRWKGSRRSMVDLVCVVHGGLAGAVLAGIGTTVTVPLLFVTLVSIHHRNPFVVYGGDTVTRMLLFLMCFAPVGEALSVDRWLLHGDAGLHERSTVWPLRLAQLQLSTVYLYSYLHKERWEAWREGKSLWYVVRNRGFASKWLPLGFMNEGFCRLMSWGTLAVQLSLGTLVWIDELTLVVALAGVGLHLAIALFLHVGLFSWIMIAALTVFITPTLFEHAAPTPTTYPPEVGGIIVIALYLPLMIFMDLPIRNTVQDLFWKYVRPGVNSIGLNHSWAMFTGTIPGKWWSDVRVIILRVDGSLSQYSWDPSGFQIADDEFLFRGRHRSRKFADSLSRDSRIADIFIDFVVKSFGPSIAAVSIIRLRYAVEDPGGEPEAPLRSALATRQIQPLENSEFDDTFVRAAFAWKLVGGSLAHAEAAKIALVVGVSMRRYEMSDATAIGRLKELVAAGATLENSDCEAFARFVEENLSSAQDCSVYFAILEDLRVGVYREMGKHPETAALHPICPSMPWPELMAQQRIQFPHSSRRSVELSQPG